MLQPVRRRTWAPSGQTPIQRPWDRHDRLSGIGAVAVSPIRHHLSFYFHLQPDSIQTEDMKWFLTEMHRHFGRKVILIWDRWSVHRAATSYFETHHPDWFQFEELPSYSPELNPVEQRWNYTKYSDLANFLPDDLEDLEAAASQSLRSQSENQPLLRSAFEYCQLKL